MVSESGITIPQDIITSILYRLPVKSLGRFRCVSKEWLSLISQPKFIKSHQNTLNQNHLIFNSKESSLYSLPFTHHQETSIPTKIVLDWDHADIYTFHGSCNGLALVSAYDLNRNGSYKVIIFNPSTKDFLEVPISGNEMINDLDVDMVFGFGYDSVTDDYKVVTVSYFHYQYLIPSGDDMFVHVYSVKRNTWKQVSVSPYDHSYGKSLSGVFVNGFLHWIARKGFDRLPVIVAFSLADEKFSEVSLPDFCNDVGVVMSDNYCKLVALGEKLAIFVEVEGVVWLMNVYGVKKSWRKIVVHGFNEIPMDEPMVFYDKGKIMFVTRGLMIIYDVEEGTFCKSFDVYWNKRVLNVRGTYVESLVSPKLGQTNKKSTN